MMGSTSTPEYTITELTSSSSLTPHLAALQSLLQHCVNDDPSTSSIGFFAPLSPSKALAHWTADLLPPSPSPTATNSLLIATAAADGTLAATVQVVKMAKETHLFRGEVRKLLVHPRHRRAGLGRRMMDAAEAVAREQMGIEVLVLDTASDTPARAFYSNTGWLEWGVCPDYAMFADGRKAECSFFVKKLV